MLVLLMALVFQMQDTFLRAASSFQHVQFPHKNVLQAREDTQAKSVFGCVYKVFRSMFPRSC